MRQAVLAELLRLQPYLGPCRHRCCLLGRLWPHLASLAAASVLLLIDFLTELLLATGLAQPLASLRLDGGSSRALAHSADLDVHELAVVQSQNVLSR